MSKEAEKIVSERLEQEHMRKMEREAQRHTNIMEELKFMAANGITKFQREKLERRT